VDDGLLFGDNKRELQGWRDACIDRLARHRLTIHPGAHVRPASEGFPFLGFTVYPDRRRLKRRKGVYFQRRLRRMLAAYAAGDLSFEQLTASVKGWINHVKHANTTGLRRAVLRQRIPKKVRPQTSQVAGAEPVPDATSDRRLAKSFEHTEQTQ
jgi:hypothetical protein